MRARVDFIGDAAELRVVSLVTNLVPYHHARWEAFSVKYPKTTLLQIVPGDRFGVLEYAPKSTAYVPKTLFVGSSWDSIPAGEMEVAICSELNALAPQVVFLNGYAARFNWIALGWCLKRDIPVVICSESNEFDEIRRPWKEAIKRLFVSRCSAGLAGGKPQADYLVKLGLSRDSVFCGYDVVDNQHFSQGALKARMEGSSVRFRLGLPNRYFFSCARFEQKKNLPFLLRAFATYCGRSKADGVASCDLVIAGEGRDRALLERTIEESGISGKVHLIGPQNYQDLPTYYGLAEAFIHASTTEQWGLVVNEAMAAGLPVIVSARCGCVFDLVHEGINGMTFDPSNGEELAGKMMEISTNSSRRALMGEASVKIIAEWSPERFARGAEEAVRIAMAAPRLRSNLAARSFLHFMARR